MALAPVAGIHVVVGNAHQPLLVIEVDLELAVVFAEIDNIDAEAAVRTHCDALHIQGTVEPVALAIASNLTELVGRWLDVVKPELCKVQRVEVQQAQHLRTTYCIIVLGWIAIRGRCDHRQLRIHNNSITSDNNVASDVLLAVLLVSAFTFPVLQDTSARSREHDVFWALTVRGDRSIVLAAS